MKNRAKTNKLQKSPNSVYGGMLGNAWKQSVVTDCWVNLVASLYFRMRTVSLKVIETVRLLARSLLPPTPELWWSCYANTL